MRKILLSFAALCCVVTTAFSAVGDKVYFVNNAEWTGTIYAHEYGTSWSDLSTFGALESCGWQYNGKDVYVYTIQNASAVILAIENENWAKKSNIEAYAPGCYYLIGGPEGTSSWEESGATAYWSPGYYYNEIYFMDNNENYAIFDETPNAALYNVVGDNWELLNGSWPGAAMTDLGTIKNGDNSYHGYKYITLTGKVCTNINFNNNNDKQFSVAVEAGKPVFAWNDWHTFSDVTNMQLVFANSADGSGAWGDLTMWWDNDASLFKATRNDVLITEEGDYLFRILFSEGTWAARFPNTNAEGWNESVHLTPSLYSLYYTYDPATDVATCLPTACYSRQVTNGNYGTICLPSNSTSVSGATFYTIAGTVNEGAAIELLEVTWDLEAGHPYIFQASADWITVNLDASTYEANAWENYNGLHGSYYEYAIDAYDGSSHLNYLLNNNQFVKAGSGCKVGEYRAYLDMSNINPAPAHIQGRRYVRLSVEGQNAPTSIESLDAVTGNCSKVIRDGQLIIIRDGKAYNAMGTIVK